jgi:hypothetical protein
VELPVGHPAPWPARIVSGGQTGADRGGLDAAIALGIPHGGWCPRGRRAEDGAIPTRYQLRELDSRDYAARTERNVVDSDATVIVCRGPLAGGTALTARLARARGKPLLILTLDAAVSDGPVRPHNPDLSNSIAAASQALRRWLAERPVSVLNIAGPRESKCPGIQKTTRRVIVDALRYP